MMATRINYCALALAIAKNYFPEAAFAKIENVPLSPADVPHDVDVECFKQLRAQGMSPQVIGELFNLSHQGVYKRLRKAREDALCR